MTGMELFFIAGQGIWGGINLVIKVSLIQAV